MKFRFMERYLDISSLGTPSIWAAGPGSEPARLPALPMADANATRMTDIHDIKPLLNPGTDFRWLYWALAVAAAALLAASAWRLWRKRKKLPDGEMTPPPVAAETEAYQMLDILAADGDLSAKQFYFRLSAILRRYIERRYEIPAAEMTTEELLPQVDRLPLGIELAQPLKAFCRGADPVKFAGASAGQSRMAHDMAFARDFVRQTTEMSTAARENEVDGRKPAALQKTGAGTIGAEQRQ